MCELPDFSVSMCVYGGDHANYFEAALNSVVNQTVPPNEIVLTVDGPIPCEIEAVIKQYKQFLGETETAFKIIRLDRNMGHGTARRIGFENCSFDLIALMDADDLSVPNRFEKQLEYFLCHPNLSVVGGYICEFIDRPDNCVGIRTVPLEDSGIKDYMKKRCPMNQVTTMFRARDIDSVGGYLDWYCEEDYYLWIRMAQAGYMFSNIPENLVNVRVGKEMYGRRGGIRYFQSEKKLQQYMYQHKIIGPFRFLINITERLILQVLMPNKLRSVIFQKLARS